MFQKRGYFVIEASSLLYFFTLFQLYYLFLFLIETHAMHLYQKQK